MTIAISAAHSAAHAAGATAEGPPLRVLYEDHHLLAVEKPAGLVTHPAYRHPDGTLADLVFARQAARGERRPWLLHRLDRETSGVVLFAKTEQARRAVVRQFERRTVRRRYLALTSGVPAQHEGVVVASLARDPADRRRTVVVAEGPFAATRYRVLAACKGYALLLAEPLTGRTHQIRAHLAHLGAPLTGDARYLPAGHPALDAAPRALLHAYRLGIAYPGTGASLELGAPLPLDLLSALARLGLGAGLAALDSSVDSLVDPLA
ncbi:MAG: RluA family pseudouridine synthase [Ktedonobacterales bacterium]